MLLSSFVVPDASAPRGRLYVDVRPSLRATDLSSLPAMNLTARVPLMDGSTPGRCSRSD